LFDYVLETEIDTEMIHKSFVETGNMRVDDHNFNVSIIIIRRIY